MRPPELVGGPPPAPATYRARTGVFAGRRNFIASRTFTVKTTNRVAYRPRASTLVVRRPGVGHTTTVVNRRVGLRRT